MDATNPLAVIGGNRPAPEDYAKQVIEALGKDYDGDIKAVSDLLEEARALPAEIDGDATKGLYTTLIKRFRETSKRLGGLHELEKEPHYRRGQGVDQFFFALIDKCVRRDKKNKPGAADVLLKRLNDYDTRILAEEQERRRREAEEAARIEREAQEEAARLEREAEATRLAAERARAPAKIEEKTAAAKETEQAASAAAIEATVASNRAQETHVATLARPADIMRRRDDATGTLSTMGTEKYAEVTDADLLDKAKLWPFIALEAKEKALRAWANTTGHTQQMDGASIGKRPKSVVR